MNNPLIITFCFKLDCKVADAVPEKHIRHFIPDQRCLGKHPVMNQRFTAESPVGFRNIPDMNMVDIDNFIDGFQVCDNFFRLNAFGSTIK